jgi:uncharacterized membrane protein
MGVTGTAVKKLTEWTVLAVFLVGWWAMIGKALLIVHPYMLRRFSELEALTPVIVNGAMILTFLIMGVYIPIMSVRESGTEVRYS